MSGCLIVCRSLTYAQRSARSLESAGFSAHVQRLPSKLSTSGCGYAIKISENNLTKSVEILRNKGLPPKKAFLIKEDGTFAELPI